MALFVTVTILCLLKGITNRNVLLSGKQLSNFYYSAKLNYLVLLKLLQLGDTPPPHLLPCP